MQEERDNLSSPLSIEKIEAVVKTFPQRKLQALMACFPGDQPFKETYYQFHVKAPPKPQK